jgi:NTP pyrophosphatase (non-canonical NTP hydrolase)
MMIIDEQFTQHVLARASTEWHGDKVDFNDFTEALKEFIEAGNRLDRIKKALFYGRDFAWEADGVVLPTETPTVGGSPNGNAMTHAILGVATEGVELCEALLKGLTDPTHVDKINLAEEFGDVAWYRALGLSVLDETHIENINRIDKKLEARFGPVDVGFSADRANNRDLDTERKVLEGGNNA